MAKKKTYKIEFVDKILDPVHGFIDITEVEREIIALPIFKRLQSIKQLSMTNWVFPGAEHTRYIHSIGVMHIADQMAINLHIDNEKRQLLRLAGLLHDIGHYPLSHVTESVYKDNLVAEEQTLLSHNQGVKDKIDNLGQVRIPEYMKSRYTIKMHHEYIGTEVIKCDENIKKIIKKHCSYIKIEDICDIIVGHAVERPDLSLLIQLMHSELDADGIDYIMRDASFSGTSYGGFQLGMLLRNLAVKKFEGVDIVGVRPKGIPIIDQYLISKYFSYTQVIFNKHVAIYDTMAEMLTKTLIGVSKSEYPNRENLLKQIKAHCNSDEYLSYTDNFFWTQLALVKNTMVEDMVDNYIITIFNKFLHNQELPCIDELVITSNNADNVRNELKNSAIYQELSKEDETTLVLYHKKGFTDEIKETIYKKLLEDLWQQDYNDKKFKEENISRLQEGIAIIYDGEKEPKLLVDDERSIMSHLCDAKTYILRKYII